MANKTGPTTCDLPPPAHYLGGLDVDDNAPVGFAVSEHPHEKLNGDEDGRLSELRSLCLDRKPVMKPDLFF